LESWELLAIQDAANSWSKPGAQAPVQRMKTHEAGNRARQAALKAYQG